MGGMDHSRCARSIGAGCSASAVVLQPLPCEQQKSGCSAWIIAVVLVLSALAVLIALWCCSPCRSCGAWVLCGHGGNCPNNKSGRGGGYSDSCSNGSGGRGGQCGKPGQPGLSDRRRMPRLFKTEKDLP